MYWPPARRGGLLGDRGTTTINLTLNPNWLWASGTSSPFFEFGALIILPIKTS